MRSRANGGEEQMKEKRESALNFKTIMLQSLIMIL